MWGQNVGLLGCLVCSPAVTVWGDILRLFVSTFCYPGDLIDKANQKIEDVLAAIAAREEAERKKKEAERLRIWVLAVLAGWGYWYACIRGWQYWQY